MNNIPLGIRVYGLGAIMTGVAGLAWSDFALQWQPVAAGFPARAALAGIFAVVLILAGVAVNWQRLSVFGAVVLSILYAVVVVFMHGADIVQHPGTFVAWDGAAEQVALLAGGVTAYACLSMSRMRGPRVERLLRGAFMAMGVCLLMFGLAHFLYLGFTASMVPAWIPGGQTFWAILTGVAHVAAGVALLSGFKARLAVILLTVMFAGFSILVHLPLLIANPNHLTWVMNAVNLSLTGAAWTIAHALTSTQAVSRFAGQPDARHAPERESSAQAHTVTPQQ